MLFVLISIGGLVLGSLPELQVRVASGNETGKFERPEICVNNLLQAVADTINEHEPHRKLAIRSQKHAAAAAAAAAAILIFSSSCTRRECLRRLVHI